MGYNSKSKKVNIVLRIGVGGKLCFDALEICYFINMFFITIASNLVAKLPVSHGVFSTNSDLLKTHYLSKAC